jgi:hypothetical protein
VNAADLEVAFDQRFDATPEERRVVARQARDLVVSGKAEADRGSPVTIDVILDNLEDAPEGSSLPERWNWWMGALEVAYGGYRQFQVTAVRDAGGESGDGSESGDQGVNDGDAGD